MRGLVALCMTLVFAASGCVELVDDTPTSAEIDAVAAEADRALDEYADKAGHIAGTVRAADGQPLPGALVDLLGVQDNLTTDANGRFNFIDLTPGNYSLTVEAAEHLAGQLNLQVLAGQFARPEITLEALPAPEPYFTTYQFDGYTQFSTLGFNGFYCYCDFDGELDGEGLSEIVLEAVMGPSSGLGSAQSFAWAVDTYSDEDGAYFGGQESSPMRVSLPGDEVAENATAFYAYVEPQYGLMPSFGQSFQVFLTAFYNGPAPDNWSALADEP